MLTFNLSRIFKARGIDRPFSYLQQQGFSTSSSTRIANSELVHMNLRVVESLCVLFDCTPNDLLEWTPGKPEEDRANHPLAGLKRNDSIIRLRQMINALPLEKLEELEKTVKGLTGEKPAT